MDALNRLKDGESNQHASLGALLSVTETAAYDTSLRKVQLEAPCAPSKPTLLDAAHIGDLMHCA